MIARAIRMNIVATLALSAPVAAAHGQEFRVSTRIVAVRRSGLKTEQTCVGNSTNLFHAGKVYDDAGSTKQMTIYEPAHERFVLIDEERQVKTFVAFGFIETALHQREKSTVQKLKDMAARASAREMQLVRFQIDPDFTSEYNARSHEMTLKSPVMTYTITCEDYPVPQVISAYLDYADWAARLNFVVDDRAMFPAARIDVNTALREKRLLPVVVSRKVEQGGQHLKAEHKYYWDLSADDRETIRRWEGLVASKQVREVGFYEYQEPRLKEAAQSNERRPGGKRAESQRARAAWSTSGPIYRPAALSSR